MIVVFAVAGWDPLVTLFYRAGTGGGLGVLLLIAATSISVVVFFARNRAGGGWWRRRVAPILAMLALQVVVLLALGNVDTLLGVPPDHALVWAIPATFGLAGVLGFGWGLMLRVTRPQVYARIGLGAKAALVAAGAPAGPQPRHRSGPGPDPGVGEGWR